MNRNDCDYIKKILAEHIGVEPTDIHSDDFLSDDLHMSPTDLSDFVERLKKEGYDTQTLDLTEIETVNDLCDILIHDAF